MKANVLPMVRAHYKTLADAQTGKLRLRDHVTFEVTPLVVFGVCWAIRVKVPTAASIGLLTVAGVLGAFLFGVMLQVADRALNWADDPPESGPETSRHATFLREISANAGYASLVSIVTACSYVIVSVSPHTDAAFDSAVALGLSAHLVLVLFMVMARVFALTSERLTLARTGGTNDDKVTHLPRKQGMG
jgi:hypothetical protein